MCICKVAPLTQHRNVVSIFNPSDLTSVGVNVLKTLHVIDGKHYQKSLPRPHVLVSHCAVLFLPRSIQNIQETRLTIDYNLTMEMIKK